MRSSSSARALGIAAVIFAAAQAHAQATTDPAKLEEARKHMQAGKAFYEDPSGHKCEEAYREYKKAYELARTANPLKGMAVCSLLLERDGDAIAEYEKYLSLKGSQVPADEKASIESDLKALRAAVARITFSADHDGIKVVDVRTPSAGYPITNTYSTGTETTKLGLHPGSHAFTASMDGKVDLVWKVEVANGGTYNHVFEFDKEPPPEDTTRPPPPQFVMTRPVPKSVYVMGGLTLALVVPTVIFGVRALGKESDYTTANGTIPKVQADELRNDVKSADLITDVFLGVTIAAALTTGVLYIARPSKPQPMKSGWTIAPAAGPKGGGAALVGRF